MAESEEELKSLLMKVKVGSEKVGLKLNIHKMKTMASGPTTSWEIDGETVETVSDFIFLGSKITPDGQSMESRRVRPDSATSLSLFTFMHWRRKWQATPVFLSGESGGRRSLVGCHLWGRTELYTTEAT